MSYSPLVSYVKLSPNCTKPRKNKIDTITIHHMAGDLTVESCGNLFANPSRDASSNYGIGSDGRIACYVEEENRSWCSSSGANDHRAITIEVANCQIGGDWPVSDKAYAALIDLCVDICRRNNIPRLNYTGDKSGNLTMHKWFAATACPGPYLEERFPIIAQEVNARLGEKDDDEKIKDEIRKIVWEALDVILPPVYTYLSDVPDWARPTIQKLVDKGYIQGTDTGLDLDYDMCRILVINDRAGLYD